MSVSWWMGCHANRPWMSSQKFWISDFVVTSITIMIHEWKDCILSFVKCIFWQCDSREKAFFILFICGSQKPSFIIVTWRAGRGCILKFLKSGSNLSQCECKSHRTLIYGICVSSSWSAALQIKFQANWKHNEQIRATRKSLCACMGETDIITFLYLFINFFGFLLVSLAIRPFAHTHSHTQSTMLQQFHFSIAYNCLMTENNFGFAFVHRQLPIFVSISIFSCSFSFDLYIYSPQANNDREQCVETDTENTIQYTIKTAPTSVWFHFHGNQTK